jgi:hypothetical protein
MHSLLRKVPLCTDHADSTRLIRHGRESTTTSHSRSRQPKLRRDERPKAQGILIPRKRPSKQIQKAEPQRSDVCPPPSATTSSSPLPTVLYSPYPPHLIRSTGPNHTLPYSENRTEAITTGTLSLREKNNSSQLTNKQTRQGGELTTRLRERSTRPQVLTVK